MANFNEVLKIAQDGYHGRDDYPPYALTAWDDRNQWTDYLKKINAEIERDETETKP